MSTSFAQKLRHEHPIGPEWQNPERIDVGDTVTLVTLPEVLGTVCEVHAYRDNFNMQPGTHTFALVSFEGITSGAEWIDVKTLSKQWGEEKTVLTPEQDYVDQNMFPLRKATGEIARGIQRQNQIVVRQAIDHAQGTVKLVLMAVPYEKLHNQFVKNKDGLDEVCNLIESVLLEFFQGQDR